MMRISPRITDAAGTNVGPPPRLDPGLSLAELLVLSGQGDVASFAQLYDATSARVHTLVLRQVFPEFADRATQQIYVSLWRRSGDYSVLDGRPLPWIISHACHELAAARASGGWRGFHR
jgi:RNA polymerase sigma-70 factor (ECF subfamily)